MKIVVKPFNKARLKLKLEGDVEFYELVQKCEEYFKVGLDYGVTKYYDNKYKLCFEVLTNNYAGVNYEITIANQEISIYAKNCRSLDDDRIALKFKEILHILSEIVECFEYHERIIHVSNATFTRYYEEGDLILNHNNILIDVEIEMDGAVGLVAKYDSTTSDNLIFKSYFTDSSYNYSFFNNTSLCFDMLYNIYDGSDVLSYS